MAVFAVALSLAGAAAARPPTAPALLADSLKAREIIQAMAARLGGPDRLRAIAGLHYAWEGDAYNGLQGYDPADLESTARSGGIALTADFDYAHHLARRDNLQVLAGGIRLDVTTLFKNGVLTTAYGTGRTAQEPGPEAAVTDGLARFTPALFARRALETIASAAYVGRRTEAGRAVEIVDVSWDQNTRLRAHVDAADKRLLALEGAGVDPLTGDDDIVYRFFGEQADQGVVFPTRVTLARRHQPALAVRITSVKVNPTFAPGLFDAPALRPLTQTRTVNGLGGGAYEITGLDGGSFRVIFVDLGDGVAVFDAPVSRAQSQAVVREIHATLGDKPAKFLILSHFHDDHVAGVGYYVGLGAKIVTTRANAAVIERYAVVESRLRPDLPAPTLPPSFLFVDGDRLDLGGAAGQVLSIYRLAEQPHAKDMLVAYQPAGKLLVEADLFVELAPYSPASAALSSWMAQPAAPQIDWIVGPHLGRTSRSDFEAARRTAPFAESA